MGNLRILGISTPAPQDTSATQWEGDSRWNIIRSEEVATTHLPLENGFEITLSKFAFAPKCDSNFISLGQSRESGIPYHNHPKCMLPKQGGSIIGSAQRRKTLFVLDLKTNANKLMIVKARGRPTSLLSQDQSSGYGTDGLATQAVPGSILSFALFLLSILSNFVFILSWVFSLLFALSLLA